MDQLPQNLDELVERMRSLWSEAVAIWISGGWAMIAIAVIALVLFSMGMHVQLRLRATGFLRVPEKRWRRWLDHPQERTGPIGALLERVADGSTVAETQRLFAHARESEIGPFERDLRVMRICVSAAPLVGLLGTVTGMLATFGALASGSGGEKTMGLVAGGISEALITTETGLVIALPGLFFQYQLARKTERYKAFLAHLETVLTQTVHLRQRDERQYVIQRAARGEIARALARRLQRPKAAT